MPVNLAVEVWRYLILIGENWNTLKRILLSLGKLDLVVETSTFEDQVGNWFQILDDQLLVQNSDIATFDFKNIPLERLIEKLNITETYFDFLTLDLDQSLIILIQMSERLCYLSMDCEKEKVGSECFEIINQNQDYLQYLIDLLENFLDNQFQ